MFKSFSSIRLYYLLRWAIIISLGLAIYYQTFGFSFVFDDDFFVVNNRYIKDINLLGGAFHTLPWTRLMGILSFALNYAINGLNPAGYHVFNFIVHLVATGLVWGVSRQLFELVGKIPPKVSKLVVIKKKANKVSLQKTEGMYQEAPFLIALLFLVHPCQIQAITYISQRFESMATVFYLATVYVYLLARVASGTRKFILFIVAAILAVLGILTKEVAVTIPVMLLAVEFLIMPHLSKVPVSQWKVKLKSFINLKAYVVLIIGGILFSLLFMKLVRAGLGIFAQTVTSESHDGDILTSGNYFLTQMRVFLTFIRLLFFPVNQHLDYDYPMSTGVLSPPLTLVGMILIGIIIFLIIRLRRNQPLITFGLAWILITFSINLAPRANVIFEHKLYLISFGFFLAVICSLLLLLRSRGVFLAVVVASVAVLSVLSYQRNQVWKSNVTMWEDNIRQSPHKERVLTNLGLSYMRANRYEEALSVFNQFMFPMDLKSYIARGQIYFELGKYEKALMDFNHALAVDKGNAEVYLSRAKVYKKQNNFDAAFVDLNQAISLDPHLDRAYVDRGVLRMTRGESVEALEDFKRALKINPGNFGALVDCAGVYLVMKRYEQAIEHLNRAQSINSSDVRVYKNRALCYLAQGKKKEALKDLEMASRLDPKDKPMGAKYEASIN